MKSTAAFAKAALALIFCAKAYSTAFAGSTEALAGAEPVMIKVLSQLDRFEPFEGHLFHEGKLWVGRSRQDLGAFYRLEVYDATGNRVAEKELTHSLRYIAPFGPSAVLIVGVGTDQMSHYTVARAAGGDITLESRTIPLGALADRFVGGPAQTVFTDPGGYDDPDHPTPPSQPLQTLFTLRNGNIHWLKPHFSLPQAGLVLGSKLYILSSLGIGAGNRFLRTVDLLSEADTVITDKMGDATKVVHFPAQNLLAVSDRGRGEVLLVDLKTNKVSATIPVEGGDNLRAMTAYGHCAAVGLERARQVNFYDLSSTTPGELVATWDLSAAGADLLMIKELAADVSSGRIFARSAYACSPTDSACGPQRNGVVLVQPEAGSQAKARCLN